MLANFCVVPVLFLSNILRLSCLAAHPLADAVSSLSLPFVFSDPPSSSSLCVKVSLLGNPGPYFLEIMLWWGELHRIQTTVNIRPTPRIMQGPASCDRKRRSSHVFDSFGSCLHSMTGQQPHKDDKDAEQGHTDKVPDTKPHLGIVDKQV